MYEWSSGGDVYQCGPKSYLNSNYLCERDPRYWDETADDLICAPLYQNGNSCVNLPTGVLCCFSSISNTNQCHTKNKECVSWWLDPDASS